MLQKLLLSTSGGNLWNKLLARYTQVGNILN